MTQEDKKLNIIVVCGSLYRRDLKSNDICSSGSDIAMEEELQVMKDYVKGRIHVVSLHKDGLAEVEDIDEKIRVYRVQEEDVKKTIRRIHEEIHGGNTDYVITQLLLCDKAIEEAKDLRIKIIYYMHSFGSKLDFMPGGAYRPDKFVVVSNHMAAQVREAYHAEPIVSRNKFNRTRNVIGEPNPNPQYDFVMFNPNVNKGGQILLHLVKAFPELKFLAVKGWTDLKDSKEDFDLQLMRLMSEAHGETQLFIPEEVSFPSIPNLTMIRPQASSGNIIQQARAVLVPSQWEDAFPRVITEACLNGKHVIGSRRGGIPENMEYSGMPKKYLNDLIVDDYSNPLAWEEKIRWYIAHRDEIPAPETHLPEPNMEEILFG